MAEYGVVAGEVTSSFKEMMHSFDGIEIVYTPFTLDRMIEDLHDTGGMELRKLKAILVVDYAFDMDTRKFAEEFVAVQDLMRSYSLNNVKLYLVTKNSDLYDMLKGDIDGVPGTYFENVQIFIIKGDYTSGLIYNVLKGKKDNTGLYNKDSVIQKSEELRLKESYEEELESRKNLSDDIVKFDRSDPVTTLSQKDYLDTPQRLQYDREKEKEERRNKKRRKELDKKKEKREDKEEKHQKTKKEEVGFEKPKKELKININNKEGETEDSVLEDLKGFFSNIKASNSNVTRGKLETDEGILSVVSDYTAGGSGIVANVADLYALSNRKVLIIDMDIENRMQTVYFKQYDKEVQNQRGASDSLIEVVQGYEIKKAAVPVSKRVDILSISREEEVDFNWVNAISGSIETILIEARNLYDIVILDIPFRLFVNYLYSLREVDRNIFVIENKFYKVEDFFENSLHPVLLKYESNMESFIRKSNIILNKFRRGMRDLEGNEINRYYLRDLLNSVGYPYDRMGVVGEIPFYEDWEKQFFNGIRYVWDNSLALGVYKRIFGKVIL